MKVSIYKHKSGEKVIRFISENEKDGECINEFDNDENFYRLVIQKQKDKYPYELRFSTGK